MNVLPSLRNVLFFVATVAVFGTGSDQVLSAEDSSRWPETFDRGIVALSDAEGVRVLWRLLPSDPPDTAFHVFRVEGRETLRLTERPIEDVTYFVDRTAEKGHRYGYFVQPIVGNTKGKPSKKAFVTPTGTTAAYLSIPLKGEYTFQKIGVADLDGDGALDFVIKQPNANIDPYEKYWQPSPDTYKLEAYRSDGTFLWRFDLGWAIERGIWYSPYVVYDLDGDGKAEVAVKTGEGDPRDADGRVQSGPEFLSVLDGQTGKIVAQTDWPPRDVMGGYNYASRNQLGVAYLDGKNPYLIVERGTYKVIIVRAYRFVGGKLQLAWEWDNRDAGPAYAGQGAHWMHADDVDGDGKQEVVLGSAVLDDDGKELWSTGLGHPDHVYVGEIDPDRPGLEIYYGMETRQRERNGMCLVDAATGKILWGYEGYTRHVHSYGMCSDIDPEHEGAECYSADTDEQKKYAWSRLWSCKGEVISEANIGGFGPRTAYWDADLYRELIIGRTIQKWQGEPIGPKLEGSYVATIDLLGDWREEIITTVPGEIRIYVTDVPAKDRRATWLADPVYRMDTVMATMGYYQVPMTSCLPSATSAGR
ncbi:MAG: silent information regulator protein Sir2 [Planctomycetota bacterium]|nr:MAG: silent information regulator protein Sir2 [Planctomycetota bacterium]